MGNKYTEIDLNSWKRQQHCQVFRGAVNPKYSVGFDLDLTHFKRKVKEKKLSFTFAFIFAVTQCANEIEEFRYRFLDGKVVLYDTIHTVFTYLDGDTELFKVVSVSICDSMEQYVEAAAATAEGQREYFAGPVENDVFVFSAMPWVSFTHVSHTDFGDSEKAQPIFDWGKFYKKGEKWMMPFSVQVHHSFVDGIHIGKLERSLQKYLDNFEA